MKMTEAEQAIMKEIMENRRHIGVLANLLAEQETSS